MWQKSTPCLSRQPCATPCENDFLTTHTQFHACPPALNYPEGGILHKTHQVPVSAQYMGVAMHFRRRISSTFAYFALELFSFILWVILFPDSRESRREICRWGGFHISETNLGQKLRSCSTWHAALTLKKSDPKCRNSRVQPLTISLSRYFV